MKFAPPERKIKNKKVKFVGGKPPISALSNPQKIMNYQVNNPKLEDFLTHIDDLESYKGSQLIYMELAKK